MGGWGGGRGRVGALKSTHTQMHVKYKLARVYQHKTDFCADAVGAPGKDDGAGVAREPSLAARLLVRELRKGVSLVEQIVVRQNIKSENK